MKRLKLLIVLIMILSMVTVLMGCGGPDKKVYTYDPGDAFITSVADSRCLMKTDITIEVTGKATVTFLTSNSYKVRDIIINILRNETLQDIQATDSQNKIKAQILTALKKDLNNNNINNIYFNDFVVQQ